MTLAERVEKAMERKECEVPDLAAACRIKPPSVHGWLNGSSKSMSAGPAIRAAAYLGVSPLWLAEGEGEMLPSKNQVLVPIGQPETELKMDERALLDGFRVAGRTAKRMMLASAREAMAIFKKRTGTKPKAGSAQRRAKPRA